SAGCPTPSRGRTRRPTRPSPSCSPGRAAAPSTAVTWASAWPRRSRTSSPRAPGPCWPSARTRRTCRQPRWRRPPPRWPAGPAPGLFAGIAWSTAGVLAATRARAAAAGLAVHLLPPGFDVDEVADLVRLRALLARGEVRLPRTTEVLAVLALRS